LAGDNLKDDQDWNYNNTSGYDIKQIIPYIPQLTAKLIVNPILLPCHWLRHFSVHYGISGDRKIWSEVPQNASLFSGLQNQIQIRICRYCT